MYLETDTIYFNLFTETYSNYSYTMDMNIMYRLQLFTFKLDGFRSSLTCVTLFLKGPIDSKAISWAGVPSLCHYQFKR